MGQNIECTVPLSYEFSAFPADVQGAVDTDSRAVRGKVKSLKEDAEVLAAEAKLIIESVNEFTTATIDQIPFSADPSDYSWVTPGSPPVPSLFRYDGGGLDGLGDTPSLNLAGFERSTFTLPIADSVSFPDAPGLPGLTSRPQAPGIAGITIPDPPSVSITLGALPTIGAAPAFSGFTYQAQFVTPDPLVIPEINLPDLSALDRVEEMVEDTFEREPYNFMVLEESVTAASALLSGNFVIDMDALEKGMVDNLLKATKLHEERMTRLWGRRGFTDNAAAVDYTGNVTLRFNADNKKAFDAAVIRWRMKLLPVAMQLSVEAHAQMAEILGELYDVDFEFLEAEHIALQSLYELAVARYNIAALQIDRARAEYSGQSLFVRARAENFSAFTRQQEAVGRLNDSIAGGYAAQQRAKESEGDSFMAEVSGNQAQVSAYGAQMEAVQAQAQALRARLLDYEGQVAGWGADLTLARSEYQVNRAKNREIIAKNRQSASQTSSDASSAEATAEVARASATEAFVLAAELRAEIASRSGENIETDTNNAISALEYVAGVGQYRLDASQFTAGFSADRAEFRAKDQINSAVARTFNQISDGAVRAAQLTQQYRIQLANAYQSLYEAAGRADASRVSGQLSRYRGTAGLRTRGALDYSSQVQRDVAFSDDTTSSQSNNCRTEWEPATF